MDAVKYLKEYERMCRSYGFSCGECGINKMRNGDGCTSIINKYPEEAVSIVEKWSKQHPVKTRQSEFLQLFPNANLCNEVVQICPRKIDANSVSEEVCRNSKCSECYRNYWFADIGDQHE